MAETEVSKEVSKMAVIEEKCGLEMSSCQDLPRPDCNGTHHHSQHDLDNSYVFVSGADGLLDDVDNKSADAEVSSVQLESEAKGQGADLDSQIEKIEAVNVENGITKHRNATPPLVNVDIKDVEAEDLSVRPESSGTGVEDQGAELDSQIEKTEGVNVENGITEHRNATPSVNVDIKDVEAEDFSVCPESNGTGVEDQGAELDSQIEKIEGVNVENGITEHRNATPSSVNVDIKDVEAEDLSVRPESNGTGVEDQEVELDFQIGNVDARCLNDTETRKTEQTDPDLPLVHVDNEAVAVEVSSVLPESEAVNVENGITEHRNATPPLVNVDIKDVEAEDSSVHPESNGTGVEDQGPELDSQIGNVDARRLSDAESRNTEQTDPDLSVVHVDNKVQEAVGVKVQEAVLDQGEELDSKFRKCDTVGEEFQPLNEAEHRNIESEGSCVLPEYDAAEVNQGAEPGNRSIEQSNGVRTSENYDSSAEHEDGEGVQVSVSDSLEKNTESSAEAAVKLESFDEAEVEEGIDQSEKVEVLTEGEDSSSGPVENREIQFVASGLVAESGKSGELNDVLLNINSSHRASDECQDQSNSSVTEASEACQGSQDTIEDVVECEATADVEDEVKLTRELAEAPVNEVPSSASLDFESYPSHSKDNTLEEATKTDVLENQQGDTAISNDIQGLVGQMDESKTVVSSSDFHVPTVCDPVLEEKNEDICVSEEVNSVQNAVEIEEQPDRSEVSHDTTPSENKIETVCDPVLEEKNDDICVSEEVNSVQNSEEIEEQPERGEVSHDTTPSENKTEASNARSENEISEEETDRAVSSTHNDDPKSQITEKVTDDVKLVANGDKEAENVELDKEGTDDTRDQLQGTAEIVQENGDTGSSQRNETSIASAGCSSENKSDEKEGSVKIETKPFNFLIRSPRFDDENLREQIRLAKVHVDEKTKLRDAIQIQIQEIRANSQIHGIDYEYAKNEARGARKLVRSKRMEIDSLQSVINKAKNALSIEDIDSQIHNMEHMIQHETLPLKEEKQLIREIKQLKQLREQLSSNMGSQDEIRQAVEQREEVEERLKILRKELDILKNRVLKAEATAAEAEKKYDDENKKVKELQARFRAADDVRQAAYAQWQDLRKELSKKSEHFFKYKDDAAIASNYAFSRDIEALYHLCRNQVENFMKLWNTNDEFRREYAKFNARSTVRRFGTLDGRPLGPNEEPPLLPSYSNERVSRLASTPVKADLASEIPSPEVKQETRNENGTLDGKNIKKATESKYQKVTKEPTITVQLQPSNGLDISDKELIVEEPPVKSREEIESLRREEEKRREEAEAKLKEQRRLEALEKAHEARERKKRQAEKLQMRAELRTQKEAEQREKEREKRLRKKERKKAGVTDGNETNNSCETTPSSETPVESSKDIEVKETSSVGAKKPQKPWLFAKQSKAKSIPPPLRNRNKKKLQQWMWVGITSFIILVLFWLGNIGVFSNVALRRRGPVH